MPTYRVLLVDNVREQRRTLRAELLSLDRKFDITDVASGEEALLVLARQPVDLLVTGFHLAGISGVELAQKARQRLANLGVILLAGKNDLAAARQAGSKYVDHLLPRPVDAGSFLEAVRLCLRLAAPDGPPAPAEVAAPEQAATAERPSNPLEKLRQEMGAAAVLVVDEHGQVVASAGGLPSRGIGADLAKAAAASLGAGEAIFKALGAAGKPGVQVFRGARYAVCLAQAGEKQVLLALVETVEGELPAGWYERLLKAAGEIRLKPQPQPKPRPQAEAQPQPQSQPRSVKPGGPAPLPVDKAKQGAAWLDTQPLKSETDPAFEKMFHQATAQQLEPADVDEFWENLADEAENDGNGNNGMISYEQARRMGLAPGEGDR